MFAPPADLNEADYERLEAAVMETERGRWFLQEFARRRRAEASGEVLSAIARLEARGAAREMQLAETRREAARAAATLAQTVQRLHDFALGVDPDVLCAAEAPEGRLVQRLQALQRLDGMDIAAKVKLFG